MEVGREGEYYAKLGLAGGVHHARFGKVKCIQTIPMKP